MTARRLSRLMKPAEPMTISGSFGEGLLGQHCQESIIIVPATECQFINTSSDRDTVNAGRNDARHSGKPCR